MYGAPASAFASARFRCSYIFVLQRNALIYTTNLKDLRLMLRICSYGVILEICVRLSQKSVDRFQK